jgi:hypothetical protein
MSTLYIRYPATGTSSTTVTTIGTIDSVTASANGGVISGNSLIFQSASATVPGLVNTTNQTFAGPKTFNNDVSTGGNFRFNADNSGLTHAAGNSASLMAAGAEILRAGTTALTVVASPCPFIQNAGTAAATSYSFSGSAGSGMYSPGANQVGLASNGTAGLTMSSVQDVNMGSANSTNMQLLSDNFFFGRNISTEAPLICNQVNDGNLRLSGGASSSTHGRINLFGHSHATLADIIQFQTAGTTAGQISATQAWTIGAGTSTQHTLQTLLATNGAQTATMTNLPAAATSGNPNGWLQITVNGTTSYIPFWH